MSAASSPRRPGSFRRGVREHNQWFTNEVEFNELFHDICAGGLLPNHNEVPSPQDLRERMLAARKRLRELNLENPKVRRMRNQGRLGEVLRDYVNDEWKDFKAWRKLRNAGDEPFWRERAVQRVVAYPRKVGGWFRSIGLVVLEAMRATGFRGFDGREADVQRRPRPRNRRYARLPTEPPL